MNLDLDVESFVGLDAVSKVLSRRAMVRVLSLRGRSPCRVPKRGRQERSLLQFELGFSAEASARASGENRDECYERCPLAG